MLTEIVNKVQKVCEDLTYPEVVAWRAKNPGKPVVGYLPAYAPREIVLAAGGLPVGIWGGSVTLEIVQGDAYFQSYICHLPRSVIELAKQGVFAAYDGLIFPTICDVLRNLSGMWKILFPQQWAKYLDFPQNLDPKIGGVFYQQDLRHLAELVLRRAPDAHYENCLREAIRLTNRQNILIQQLKDLRATTPHLIPIEEYYCLLRSSIVLHPQEHMQLLSQYLSEIQSRHMPEMDNIRVVVIGAFCEQPPLALLKAIERAGCYIVDHDLLLGVHWFTQPLLETGDPFASLADGYLTKTTMAPFKYQGNEDRGAALVSLVKKRRADGVILAAPSFCDPALLERPMLKKALEDAGIPFTLFLYAENTGQYQVIREQAGTFSDSIRLWGKESR